jgi:23S rRNA pseudouridine1911/1915/1917 synthase
MTEERRGERLDRALAALLPDHSRAALQRLLRDGRVLVEGTVGRAAARVHGGESVTIDLPPVVATGLAAEDLPLQVLYEDRDLIVIDKRAGMVVHPGAGARAGTLVNALLHHCHDLSGIGGVERPGIVHRLDRDTSGVLVVAKNDATHRSLARQFKDRSVTKVYEALVWGMPRPSEGVVDNPIGRHPTARVKMAVSETGRPARTRYRLIAACGPASLLEVRPETGRTHQIRVHLSALGHPIVGDPVYGGEWRPGRGGAATRPFVEEAGMALHARRLGFTHPRDGAWRDFEAPRPARLTLLIEAMGAPAPERARVPGRRT